MYPRIIIKNHEGRNRVVVLDKGQIKDTEAFTNDINVSGQGVSIIKGNRRKSPQPSLLNDMAGIADRMEPKMSPKINRKDFIRRNITNCRYASVDKNMMKGLFSESFVPRNVFTPDSPPNFSSQEMATVNMLLAQYS